MTVEELAGRKKQELEQKVKALEDELDGWCEKSEKGEAFEKHNTQIRAVRAQMQGWNEQVRGKLDEYAAQQNADGFLSKCPNADRLILSQHRIWDYFRSKFIQREEPLFNPYLAAADEFAWACYHPIQQLVYPDLQNAARKEPPLVFFNGGASPFSLSRDRSFQPEMVAGETLNIDPANIVNKLPIPVVGVPWQQISHLPEALVIGHEVGHIVEDDFELEEGLKTLLDAALEDADKERKSAWHSWLGEIFADLYGCLAAGPAFAGALIDFLAKDSDRISTEEKTNANWGRYPTDFLRVKIVLEALESMGFAAEIADYQTLWGNFSSKMPAEYEKDIEKIVPMLLDGAHPKLGKSVKSAFCFSAEQQKKVNAAVAQIYKIKPGAANNIGVTDIRVLFAALRTAFEKKPVEYKADNYGKHVLDYIKTKVINPGVRSGEVKLTGKTLDNKLENYKQVGEELFNTYFSEEIEKDDLKSVDEK